MNSLSFTVASCLRIQNSFMCLQQNRNWAQICMYHTDVSPNTPLISYACLSLCTAVSCKAATGKSTCLPAEIIRVCFSKKSHVWFVMWKLWSGVGIIQKVNILKETQNSEFNYRVFISSFSQKGKVRNTLEKSKSNLQAMSSPVGTVDEERHLVDNLIWHSEVLSDYSLIKLKAVFQQHAYQHNRFRYM